MWLVTPAALTAEDRLRQKGMDVTPDNLAQQVVNDSEPIVVKNENNGCLKAILIAICICILFYIIYTTAFMYRLYSYASSLFY